MRADDVFDPISASCDERDFSAASEEVPDQREPEARCSAGDGDAHAAECGR
jgi:hypothetical protein